MAPRVVILGGGFAGAYCAQAIDRAAGSRGVDVLLLDANNYFVFYPLLIEAGTGSLQPSHVVVPIRSFLRRGRFKMAVVTDVDLERRSVRYRFTDSGESAIVTYDHLVLALGSVTRLPHVPGLRDHGFEVKSLADAIGLRDRAIRLVEQADATDDRERRRTLLHWVVVGANFTGAEMAGEFHTFLQRMARRYQGLTPDDCRITLVEIADRILGSLDRELAEFARADLVGRGVEVRTETSVNEIGPDRVVLSTGDVLSSATVVWCAGIAPNPLLGRLALPHDERGYVLTEPDLGVRGTDRVWAIGDCAVNPDDQGRPYPATAQHAVREGAHLARNIIAALDGRPTAPFRYRSAGAIAALGCRSGVARIGRLKVSGFAAWWLHRTVYLLKMPGLARKLRVALDWSMDLGFPRDYVSLGLAPDRPRREG